MLARWRDPRRADRISDAPRRGRASGRTSRCALRSCLTANSQVTLLALSGMETSLFMLAVAVVFLRWSEDDAVGSAVAVGLASWVRPEGLLLAVVLAIDAALARRLPRRALAAAAIFIALFGGYVALNFAVGGRWLPETVSATAALAGA